MLKKKKNSARKNRKKRAATKEHNQIKRQLKKEKHKPKKIWLDDTNTVFIKFRNGLTVSFSEHCLQQLKQAAERQIYDRRFAKVEITFVARGLHWESQGVDAPLKYLAV